MKICLDYQSAVTQVAGVGRYTRSLAQQLAPLAGPDALRLFYFDFQRRAQAPSTPGLRLQPCRWCPGRLVQGTWKTLGWPPFDLLAGPADLYHFPNFILPPLRRGKAVVTIHDASFLRHPAFAETRNLRHLTANIRRTVERAQAVITDSAFSAAELRDLLDVPANLLHAIHLGISPVFRPADPARVQDLCRSLDLQPPYLLSVSTLEPRKNIPFLVQLFEALPDLDARLVIAGGRGWKCEPILQRIHDSPRSDRIRCLDHVADADLPALYSGASLFLVASHYEGFGLPPLEAMACGTPVLSSSGGSLPEVLGDAAAVMADFDLDAWAATLRGILEDEARHRDLAARGRARAAVYTWERTARRTWDVYRKVAGDEPGPPRTATQPTNGATP